MNWTILFQFLFWISAGLILYAYFGFPLLLLLRGMIRRPVHKSAITPHVSLLITAHNEACSISGKLDNVLGLDYPREHVEVLVASDGSDDGTDTIVRDYAGYGVRLLSYPRQGKVPTLNAAVPHATGEIVLFSDANSMYDRDAIRCIVQPFADPSVGGVAGNQVYARGADGHAAGYGERLYWSFDRFLKSLQTRAGNVISSTGAIHAIRRELFQPVPPGVSDDFVISTRVVLQRKRLVFEPGAIAYESIAASDGAEFHRKVRVIVRGLRGLWAVRGLFNPVRHGFYAIQIFSHKLLRWSVGWLLLILLTASIALWASATFYRLVAATQLGFYSCALLGFTLRRTSLVRRTAFKVLAIPFYFSLANVAAMQAWLQLLAGARVDRWESARNSGTVEPHQVSQPAALASAD
jgi:cellulose synthase/poly-beta-1,6-N-acetylglucosamine synthase-like glycosyltransferase